MVGSELRKVRESAGLTQEQVAAAARLSREYVSHVERGRYKPTIDVFLRICTAMGIRGWRVLRRFEERKLRR